ncbi:unnamed protein product [Phytophthora lilii]|uniref:Unnamed protein product n=1 Tax=Phytophthora lilii TaxID=2077276 RepID=A0A9W6TDN7_9STRA|nr:unnamed protein product [Phytophthora lilii]
MQRREHHCKRGDLGKGYCGSLVGDKITANGVISGIPALFGTFRLARLLSSLVQVLLHQPLPPLLPQALLQPLPQPWQQLPSQEQSQSHPQQSQLPQSQFPQALILIEGTAGGVGLTCGVGGLFRFDIDRTGNACQGVVGVPYDILRRILK